MEDLWKPIKGDLLSAADKIYGLTKGLLRHQVTWWWKKDVNQAIAVESGRKLKKIQREQSMW